MKKIAFIIDDCTIELLKKRIDVWADHIFKSKLSNEVHFLLFEIGDSKCFLVSEDFFDDPLIVNLANWLKYFNGYGKVLNIKGFLINSYSTLDNNIDKGNKVVDTLKLVNNSDSTKNCKSLLLKYCEEKFKKIDTDSLLINEIDLESIFNRINDYDKEISNKKSVKNFKIYSLIIILILICEYFINYNFYNYFLIAHLISTSIIITFFYSDYKLLRNNVLYIYSLLFALIVFLVPLYFRQYSTYFWISNFELYISFYPLCFLLVQKPIRLLFIKHYKREPIVDRNVFDINNSLYSFLIVIIPIIIIIFISLIN